MGFWTANNLEADTLEELAKEIANFKCDCEDESDIFITGLEYINDGYVVEAAEDTRLALEKDAQEWQDYYFQCAREEEVYRKECDSLIYFMRRL